jgi:glycosyltransferase involved in cell wall biosynthesis
MKVLHIISSGGMYGAEAVILNLSRSLAETGHSTVIAAFSNSANPNLQLHHAALQQGFDSQLIPCSGQLDLATLSAIRQLAVRIAPEVVHAHGYKADLYAYFALRGRIPLVSTCHTWYDTGRMVSLYGKLDRLVLRGFARVVAVSAEVRQRLFDSGVRDRDIRIVRNGIDLRPFTAAQPSLPKQPGQLLIGLVGRLAWEKGIDIFLATAARLAPEFPSAKFVVIGDGPDRDKLEHTIDALQLRSSVSLLGRRDDMPSVYASLDIMVSSSRQEGLPIAILEGMASALPLVATAVGEVSTVVLDGLTGLLVPPEDSERLAAAIHTLLRDPAQRTRLAAAARKLIKDEYSAERMASDYLRVYKEAIAAVQP